MDDLKVFATTMTRKQFLTYLIEHADFCSVLIDPQIAKHNKDYAQSEVLFERRGPKVFILTNRKNFGAIGCTQYRTWIGNLDTFVNVLQQSPWTLASLALTNFVTKCTEAKDFGILRTALDEIHYTHGYAILGERAYMVNHVQKGSRKVKPKASSLSGNGQMTLF